MNDTCFEVRVNGRPTEIRAARLDALLAEMGIDPTRSGIAVARNGAVVPRSRWTDTEIAAGDELEIIGAKQGG